MVILGRAAVIFAHDVLRLVATTAGNHGQPKEYKPLADVLNLIQIPGVGWSKNAADPMTVEPDQATVPDSVREGIKEMFSSDTRKKPVASEQAKQYDDVGDL